MATINLSYGSYQFKQTISIQYNDTSHAVVNGAKNLDSIPSGLGAGVEFYRQQGSGEYWSVRVQNTVPYAYVVHVIESGGGGGSGLPDDLTISVSKVDETPTSKGSATITATGSGTKRYSINGGTVQVSNVFNNLSAGTYTFKVSRTEDSTYRTSTVTISYLGDITITLEGTNISAAGANDGKVKVRPTNGSGKRILRLYKAGVLFNTVGSVGTPFTNNTYTWVNLAPDTYTVEVTDTATNKKATSSVTLTEPVVIPDPTTPPTDAVYYGTVFELPFIGSISFVKDNQDEEQGLDNTLFCNQEFKNITDNRYYQKLCKKDRPVIQFTSNYQNHFVELYNYKTDALISSYSIDTLEDNITDTVEYGITLKADSAGRTRVYFNQPIIPLPFSINQVFSIKSNSEGMNGQYSIVDIQTDLNTGFQYLVITKAYGGAGASSLATGDFINPIGYNVYESTLTFDTLPEGLYYVKVYALSPNPISATSEPIHLKTEHKGTCTITYANEDNAYNVIFSTGYKGFLRIPSLFGHKRITGGERTMSRDSNFSLVKVSSRKQRLLIWEVFGIPPYLYEKLSVVCDLDIYSINGVACQSSEGFDKPEQSDKSVILDAAITLEQLNWFGTYNSDNLMSTVSSSGCLCDEIDLIAVSTSIATIALNMNNKRQRIFQLTPNIDDDKEIVLSNDTVGLSFELTFTMDADKVLTLPDNFRILSNNDWDNAAKTWLCSITGKYKMQMTMDGSEWVGTIII